MRSRTNMALGSALAVATFFLLCGCRSMPKGAMVITDFQLDNYLGKWYEIARLDHRFERGLRNVTAEYILNDDGSIGVINKGFDIKQKEWKTAKGKAKPAGRLGEGALKVSFFGPFYSPYNIIALDTGYNHALVVGKNQKYLWILSREKTIPDTVRERYLQQAADLGFKTEHLIWVSHD